MGLLKRKKCRNCKCLFIPDHRNRDRQKYCCRPECRKASKAESQQKWLSKPENQDYFRTPENVQRVQQWREENPEYWKCVKKPIALQDRLNGQRIDNIKKKGKNANNTLQDPLIAQDPVIIGLISNFIGSALQDDIAETLLRMQQSGQDILYSQPVKTGGIHDCQITDTKTPGTQNPQKLQLDRSSAG